MKVSEAAKIWLDGGESRRWSGCIHRQNGICLGDSNSLSPRLIDRPVAGTTSESVDAAEAIRNPCKHDAIT
jgi:hypothetical protein